MKHSSKFFIDGHHVGYLLPDVLSKLKERELVEVEQTSGSTPDVHLIHTLHTPIEKEKAFAELISDWRDRDVFPALRGWRNEVSRAPVILFTYV